MSKKINLISPPFSNVNNTEGTNSGKPYLYNYEEYFYPKNTTPSYFSYRIPIHSTVTGNWYRTSLYKSDFNISHFNLSQSSDLFLDVVIEDSKISNNFYFQLLNTFRFTTQIPLNIYLEMKLLENELETFQKSGQYFVCGTLSQLRKFSNIKQIPPILCVFICEKEGDKLEGKLNEKTVRVSIDLPRFTILLLHLSKSVLAVLKKYSTSLEIQETEICLRSLKIADLHDSLYEIMKLYNSYYTVTVRNNRCGEVHLVSGKESILPSSGNILQSNLVKIVTDEEEITFIGTVSELKKIVGKGEEFITCNPTQFIVNEEVGEFYKGKRYGKINKITKLTNCTIEVSKIQGLPYIKPGVDSNETLLQSQYLSCFKFQIPNQTPLSQLLPALSLIEDEYPSLLSFHLDSSHHRKIIGVKGSQIQKFMKKYDVYVKFMDEVEALNYRKNVLCKTFRKNEKNLELIKKEILAYLNCPSTEIDEIEPIEETKLTKMNVKYPNLSEMLELFNKFD